MWVMVAGGAVSQVPASLLRFARVCRFLCVHMAGLGCHFSGAIYWFFGTRPLTGPRLDSRRVPALSPHSAFLHGLWVLNIGSHTCETSILKTELSPQPGVSVLTASTTAWYLIRTVPIFVVELLLLKSWGDWREGSGHRFLSLSPQGSSQLSSTSSSRGSNTLASLGTRYIGGTHTYM